MKVLWRLWKTLPAFIFFAALSSFGVGGPQVAVASEPSEQAKLAKAEIRFFEGLRAFRQKKYEAAITAFQTVYSQTQHPDMLFNIARAYEELSQPEIAAKWYRGLAKAKPVDQSATLRRIERLAPKNEPATGQKTAQQALEEQALLALKPVELQSRGTRWLKWSLIGVAGTALTVATVVGIQSLDHAKLRDDADDDLSRAHFSNQADRSQLTALSLAGLGLITGGIATYLIIDEASPKPIKTGVGAILTNDGASVSYSTSF